MGTDKDGKHVFNFSPYAIAFDLLSSPSQTRCVTAYFHDKEFLQDYFSIDTKMSQVKSTLLRSLPQDLFDGKPRDDGWKHMRLTLDGMPVDDDNVFGLCSREGCKTNKVATSDDDDNIIIRVYMNEGMDSLSSGLKLAESSKVR